MPCRSPPTALVMCWQLEMLFVGRGRDGHSKSERFSLGHGSPLPAGLQGWYVAHQPSNSRVICALVVRAKSSFHDVYGDVKKHAHKIVMHENYVSAHDFSSVDCELCNSLAQPTCKKMLS